MENIIYFRLHDLSSSKWIDPPHTPPPPLPPAHTRRNDGESTRDEQSKKRTNGAAAVTGELGANFPLDLKGSQVESRFSKCSNTEERMYSSKITRVLGQKERKEGKKEKICFSTRYHDPRVKPWYNCVANFNSSRFLLRPTWRSFIRNIIRQKPEGISPKISPSLDNFSFDHQRGIPSEK